MIPLLGSLTDQLQNQFVSGGLIVMAAGALMALARKIPSEIFYWLVRRISVDIHVRNTDPLFDSLSLWLSKLEYSSRSRRLEATTVDNFGNSRTGVNSIIEAIPDHDHGAKEPPTVIFSPSIGIHWVYVNGQVIRIDRHKDEMGSASKVSGGGRMLETISVKVFTRSTEKAKQIIRDASMASFKVRSSIKIYNSVYGNWRSYKEVSPRAMDSVILPQGEKDALLEDAKKFINSSEWYKQLGIPWHRGYLFHGVAGSGKSSLIAALAGELKMDMYVLSLGSSGMDDDRLEYLFSEIRKGSIILIEDADCVAPDRELSPERKGVSLSALLNCLDGMGSIEGTLLFMTTNRIDKLDPALIRPGRIDYRLEFKPANLLQLTELWFRINNGSKMVDSDYLQDCCGKSMAEAQRYLIERL